MSSRVVGVLGATSLIGEYLLEKSQADESPQNRYIAFSRKMSLSNLDEEGPVRWICLEEPSLLDASLTIERWICLVPIWVLPEYFSLMGRLGVRRVVVLSSTSLFSKLHSVDLSERMVSNQLESGERAVIDWALLSGVEWVILRPTLIYGRGKDRNITAIANFVKRFGFFPVIGPAKGTRQPMHASDVALACQRALDRSNVVNQSYNISGAETLTYREMVERVFTVLGKKKRIVSVPLLFIRVVLPVVRFIPGYRGVTLGMAERMNRDMVFDHANASADFGFEARPFELCSEDVS